MQLYSRHIRLNAANTEAVILLLPHKFMKQSVVVVVKHI